MKNSRTVVVGGEVSYCDLCFSQSRGVDKHVSGQKVASLISKRERKKVRNNCKITGGMCLGIRW